MITYFYYAIWVTVVQKKHEKDNTEEPPPYYNDTETETKMVDANALSCITENEKEMRTLQYFDAIKNSAKNGNYNTVTAKHLQYDTIKEYGYNVDIDDHGENRVYTISWEHHMMPCIMHGVIETDCNAKQMTYLANQHNNEKISEILQLCKKSAEACCYMLWHKSSLYEREILKRKGFIVTLSSIVWGVKYTKMIPVDGLYGIYILDTPDATHILAKFKKHGFNKCEDDASTDLKVGDTIVSVDDKIFDTHVELIAYINSTIDKGHMMLGYISAH